MSPARIIYLWRPTEKRLAENAFKISPFQEEIFLRNVYCNNTTTPHPHLPPNLVYELGHQPLWHAPCLEKNELQFFSKLNFTSQICWLWLSLDFHMEVQNLIPHQTVPSKIWSKDHFISSYIKMSYKKEEEKNKTRTVQRNGFNSFTLWLKLNIYFQWNNCLSLQEIYST